MNRDNEEVSMTKTPITIWTNKIQQIFKIIFYQTIYFSFFMEFIYLYLSDEALL